MSPGFGIHRAFPSVKLDRYSKIGGQAAQGCGRDLPFCTHCPARRDQDRYTVRSRGKPSILFLIKNHKTRRESIHASINLQDPQGFHADRATGRDLDHRGFDLAALARRAVCARSCRRAQCVNNLKQIGLALYNYENSVGAFPPGYIDYQNNPNNTPDLDMGPGWGWAAMLLPFLEQQPLYNSINFSLGITVVSNPATQPTARP